jgi:hypothetical protein
MDPLDPQSPELQQAVDSQRKPYLTPVIKDFGSVAELTRALPDYLVFS